MLGSAVPGARDLAHASGAGGASGWEVVFHGGQVSRPIAAAICAGDVLCIFTVAVKALCAARYVALHALASPVF